MYRSWAYILMMAATLAGVIALAWPSPEVRTIEEIAMPSRAPARAEPAPKPKGQVKAGAAKPAKPEPPPEVVKRMPEQTTATKRAGGAVINNGMEANSFGKPGETYKPPIIPKPAPGAPAFIPPSRPQPPPRTPMPGRSSPPTGAK